MYRVQNRTTAHWLAILFFYFLFTNTKHKWTWGCRKMYDTVDFMEATKPLVEYSGLSEAASSQRRKQNCVNYYAVEWSTMNHYRFKGIQNKGGSIWNHLFSLRETSIQIILTSPNTQKPRWSLFQLHASQTPIWLVLTNQVCMSAGLLSSCLSPNFNTNK